MLRLERIGRLTAVLAAAWVALCLFWYASDKFYNGQFMPWLLIGLVLIVLGTVGAVWALQPNDQLKQHQRRDQHQPN